MLTGDWKLIYDQNANGASFPEEGRMQDGRPFRYNGRDIYRLEGEWGHIGGGEKKGVCV